ncbi:helix-turn-helix transcriptional regulator [Paenibacillus agricola]|uniref:Helix-turn-helix transcriptional regulator n=1 Tax=Paenibacillus agricola TaxID=2716264 RepID=A0ABX0J1Q7_9BACL|nr:AraC family transcriptional regulator [Paenibacillus agricola]NHN29888.1 helix-turn-helix transcriptional regulator [Paenibacillus agricola]
MIEQLGTEAIPSFSVTEAVSGSVIYGPGGTYGPRLQADLQLVLLHSGAMTVEIDKEKHAVPTGNVVLLKPGHIESFVFADKRETWHRWIAVSVEPLDKMAIDFFDSLPLFIPLTDKINQMTDIIQSLQRDEVQKNEELARTLGRASILLYLTACNQGHINDRKHPAVLLAKEEIHKRYAEELTLSVLSKVTKNTPEHLIRLFRRDEDMTPIQYLWNYRVKQGIDLLRSTGLQIGEVAEQVGFKTSYHFARTIKRHSGKTPSEIRKESYTNIRTHLIRSELN